MKGELKMNKYQENLDFIVKNSCPQKTICRECNFNKSCNCLAKEHIDSLQELIENHFDLVEKYKELEKALDKACFMLEKEMNNRVANAEIKLSCGIKTMNKEEWKEWCLNEK